MLPTLTLLILCSQTGLTRRNCIMCRSETSSLHDTVQYAHSLLYMHISVACPHTSHFSAYLRHYNLIAVHNFPAGSGHHNITTRSRFDWRPQHSTTATITSLVPTTLCHAHSTTPGPTPSASVPPASTTSPTSSHASQASSKHKPSLTMSSKSINPNSSRSPLSKPSSRTKIL